MENIQSIKSVPLDGVMNNAKKTVRFSPDSSIYFYSVLRIKD